MNTTAVSLSSPSLPAGPSSTPVDISSVVVVSPSSPSPPTPTSSNAPPPSSTPQTTPQSSVTLISIPPTTEQTIITSLVVQSPTSSGGPVVTVFQTLTSGTVVTQGGVLTTSNSAPAATSTAAGALNVTTNDQNAPGGLLTPGRTAVAVVVPVVAVALLVLAGLFLWRKRKQRKDAEELRKKEMEEYTYNPNNDPTIPVVGGMSSSGDEPSTMRERDEGYRGWGTTSTNRKASTTMSNRMARSDSGGNAYNGQHSPTTGTTHNSDVNSGDPLVDRTSANSETIGALGGAPVTANRSAGGVNRGPSNASSAYSGANRSDTSGEGPLPNTMGSPQYYNDLMYQDEMPPSGAHGDGSWGGCQPVIRDVQARRNTRIENPSVVPQQGNAGISQNF